MGRLLALLANIRLGWKGLRVENTLGYCGPAIITVVHAPGKYCQAKLILSEKATATHGVAPYNVFITQV